MLSDDPITWLQGNYLLYPRRLNVVQSMDGFTAADLNAHTNGCLITYGSVRARLDPFRARLSQAVCAGEDCLYRILNVPVVTAFLAAQGAAALAGALLLLAVGAGRMPIGLFVATAWLGGTGALAAQRLLYAQAGIAWSLVALTLPWIIMAGLVGVRLRRSWPSRSSWSSWSSWSKKLRAQATVASILEDAAAVTVIAVWTALLLRQAVNTPLAGWDAMAIWFLKGRAFFETGGMPWGFFADPRFPPYAHLDYPLLVPLTIAGTYAWTGDLDTLIEGLVAAARGSHCRGAVLGTSGEGWAALRGWGDWRWCCVCRNFAAMRRVTTWVMPIYRWRLCSYSVRSSSIGGYRAGSAARSLPPRCFFA